MGRGFEAGLDCHALCLYDAADQATMATYNGYGTLALKVVLGCRQLEGKEASLR